MLCLRVVCTAGTRKEMAGAKSQEEAMQNYIVQPFARQIFDVMSSRQLLAQKSRKFFVYKNIYENLTNVLPFIMHSILHKLRTLDVPCQQFKNCCILEEKCVV